MELNEVCTLTSKCVPTKIVIMCGLNLKLNSFVGADPSRRSAV